MARQQVALYEHYLYEDNEKFVLGDPPFDCCVLDLAEVTAESIHNKLANMVSIPKISIESIQEWLDNDPHVEPLYIGQCAVYFDCDDLEVIFELELRNYIKPPFGSLQGKQIFIDNWS